MDDLEKPLYLILRDDFIHVYLVTDYSMAAFHDLLDLSNMELLAVALINDVCLIHGRYGFRLQTQNAAIFMCEYIIVNPSKE